MLFTSIIDYSRLRLIHGIPWIAFQASVIFFKKCLTIVMWCLLRKLATTYQSHFILPLRKRMSFYVGLPICRASELPLGMPSRIGKYHKCSLEMYMYDKCKIFLKQVSTMTIVIWTFYHNIFPRNNFPVVVGWNNSDKQGQYQTVPGMGPCIYSPSAAMELTM